VRRPGIGAESEFGFELRVCAWAERQWPPSGPLDADTAVLVARQLGTRSRRWDTIVIEADREALRARARFGPARLDGDLLGVVRNAPAEWAYYRDALPEPDYPWRYVREAVHRAAGREIVETRKRNNRIELRRRWPYPEWVSRIIAIENKPDLDASAARALTDQLQRDVALSLADEVWVATNATDDRIEPVLFEELPTEAGVLVVGAGDGEGSAGGVEVVWYPRRLPVGKPGTEIAERPDGSGGNDRSAARFEYVRPEAKRETRRALAERAYERGWRSYVDSMRPDCRYFSLRRDRAVREPESGSTSNGQGTGNVSTETTPATAAETTGAAGTARTTGTETNGTETSGVGGLLPYCEAKGRCQRAAECGSSCPEFEPEPPAWRTGGWPIEGGPGAAVKRLLAERRRRRRPGLDE
jgi:hypothetical protein